MTMPPIVNYIKTIAILARNIKRFITIISARRDRVFIIFLLVIVVLAGILARRDSDTAPELLPVASAVSWVEGNGRAIEPDMLASGVKPVNTVRIGHDLLPRTPPVMMAYLGGVARIYSMSVGRPLDSVDLPNLLWIMNFVWNAFWALLLFGAVTRLASFLCGGEKAEYFPIHAAWAALAGSLTFGWMGSANVYLPMAALITWSVALQNPSAKIFPQRNQVISGLCAGLAGAFHPAGWVFLVLIIFMKFISSDSNENSTRESCLFTGFLVPSIVVIIISCTLNYIFFGNLLPIQFIDAQVVQHSVPGLFFLLAHDLVEYNGIFLLSPVLLAGAVFLLKYKPENPGMSALKLITGFGAIVLLVWGLMDDAVLQAEIEAIPEQLRILPVELHNGHFSLVQLAGNSGTADSSVEYFERLYSQTDIFLLQTGRPVGIPLFLPVAVLLTVYAFCAMGISRFLDGWVWMSVRWGGLVGLIMSQAPYGSGSGAFVYTGIMLGDGRMPIIESILALCIRLVELWPSGVVSF